MNEARVVIVHNSKSERDNLNVYIYCCEYHVVSEEKIPSPRKRKIKKKTKKTIATFKKCAICIDINMCMLIRD